MVQNSQILQRITAVIPSGLRIHRTDTVAALSASDPLCGASQGSHPSADTYH